MMVAGVLILYTATQVFDGGFAEATSVILQDDAEAVMPFGTAGIIALLGLGLHFWLCGCGGTAAFSDQNDDE